MKLKYHLQKQFYILFYASKSLKLDLSCALCPLNAIRACKDITQKSKAAVIV